VLGADLDRDAGVTASEDLRWDIGICFSSLVGKSLARS
jgi:hypothetical protein